MKKFLVAYFSATGTTAGLAKNVVEAAGVNLSATRRARLTGSLRPMRSLGTP